MAAVLARLRSDGNLVDFFSDRIRLYRAQQLMRMSSVEAPALAVVSTKITETLVASGRTAEVQASVLIGIVTAFEEGLEPEEVVLGAFDRVSHIKRVLARDGGKLVLDTERITDAVLKFEQTPEPLQLPGTSLLVQDLVAVFATRIDMQTGQLK